MNEQPEGPPAQELQIQLSYTRTATALDRTLLAWIRTSLSLIGFGFALARFVHDLLLHGYLHGVDPQSPTILGLGMMVLGVLGLLGGTFEHVRSVKHLRATTSVSLWSTALLVTLILAVIGLLLILNLIKDLGVPDPALLSK